MQDIAIFRLESTGALPPADIVMMAIEVRWRWGRRAEWAEAGVKPRALPHPHVPCHKLAKLLNAAHLLVPPHSQVLSRKLANLKMALDAEEQEHEGQMAA